MKYQEIREKVLAAAQQANAMGLIHGTCGNISMRDATDDVVAITPSNMPYDSLKPEDITVIDLHGNIVDGAYIPSSETPMHTAVYRARSDIRAIVQTHSLYATVMSMRLADLDRATVPSNMYYPIHTAPFAMPGSQELADAAVQALGKQGDVTLLQNHGLLATGPDMEAAMNCAVYVEEDAQVGYYAALLGVPASRYIPEEAAQKIRATALSGRAV